MQEETHLPKRVAWIVIGVAVAAAFGKFLPTMGQLAEWLKTADPWDAPDAPLHGLPKYFVLLLTGAIAWKQMSYYYIQGGTKGAVFSTVILHMNALERSLDWLLAFEGALLLPWAIFSPTLWIFGFFLYCVIALSRMIVTLRRPVYATYWSKHEFSAPLIYFWSTHPFYWVGRVELPGMPQKPERLPGEELLLWKFANSLLAHHIPKDHPDKASSVREILWGWLVSFCVHGAVALALGVVTIIVWVWLGAAVVRWVAIGSAVFITVLFYKLSRWSFRKGKHKFGDIQPKSP